MRTAVYARVSTEKQGRDQTIESQLEALRGWAAAHGHELKREHIFIDEGYSGSRLDRPALDRLRDVAREGEFDVVAVYSPDRLARRYAYQVVLLEEFRKAGCPVEFVHRPISDDPHDQLLLQIQGAVAEYERALLGERFRRGKLQKARAGHWVAGQAPYGYLYVPARDGVPAHLEVDDAEAAVVRQLHRWLIDERMTVRQILKRLADGPVRPRSGKRLWSNSVVHRILSDPVYAGTGYANRHVFVVPRKPRSTGPRAGTPTCRQSRPREEWVPIRVPAIIDESTYQDSKSQLARNSALSFRNNTRNDYLLRCLLTCRTCGLAMFGITTRDGSSRRREHRYYKCHGKDTVARDRACRCSQTPAKADELDAAVWGHVKALLEDPAALAARFEELARASEEEDDGRAAVRRWEAQLRRLGREEQRLVDAYQAEVIDLAELKTRREQIQGRRQILVTQRDQEQRLRAGRQAAKAVWSDLEAFCRRVRSRLDEATLAERQRVLQLLIERVIVGEDSLEIRHVIPLGRIGGEPSSHASEESPGTGDTGRLGLEETKGDQPSCRLRSDGVSEAALQDILLFLRTRTGCDFSYYKRATIIRRIGRRMQVNGIKDMPAYMAFLRTHIGEAGALLQDLLISVTNFFRDREAFKALEQRVPELFRGKGTGDSLRVWVPACATGEEAYSIAMLLLEHAGKLDSHPTIQIFACDLDESAIRHARLGHYPDSIAADVSEERLRRFFVKDHGGYRVRRELRELVLFATHDLLKDAPFSRMDLISCRNLLIYLNNDAQDRLIDTFHFSLKSGGYLFLGTSESIDEVSPLFRVVDKKHRLYVRLQSARSSVPIPSGPSALLRVIEAQSRSSGGPLIHGKQFLQDPMVSPRLGVRQQLDRASLAELHFRLVERLAAPSVIVNSDHEVLHLSEHAGRFLRVAGGEPSMNLPRMVDPILRVELQSVLFRAAERNETVESLGIPMEIDGKPSVVVLRVSPSPELAPGYLLVVFEERPTPQELSEAGGQLADPGAEPLVRHLERELERLKTRLRDNVEQSEASTEELKASNEELQAMNEELRSATEELETSREELQSINEELTTVNQEMKVKMDEIAHANSDLQNLMASTSIATVFLDRDLKITRYTPSAVDLFHLIPGDLGRPLDHLRHRMDYPQLMDDAEQVLRTLVPVEREVHGGNDWFLARIQPYRTLEDRIAGLVLTFVDITERRHATEAMREQLSELERFNSLVVGRETRMIELKREVNELCTRLNQLPRYNLEFESDTQNTSES